VLFAHKLAVQIIPRACLDSQSHHADVRRPLTSVTVDLGQVSAVGGDAGNGVPETVVGGGAQRDVRAVAGAPRMEQAGARLG